MDTNSVISSIINPEKLYSRSEVLSKPCPVLERGGFCAFYFQDIPPEVPVEGCHVKDSKTLLYIGISGNLRTRVVSNHFRGNASISTLRLSMGLLLSLSLRRVKERIRFTREDEEWLNDWMEDHAFVCWVEHNALGNIKGEILTELSPPLNIDYNKHHPFSMRLSRMREDAKNEARSLPIVNE